MRNALLAAVFVLLAPSLASARPLKSPAPAAAVVRFLGKDPHGPLAVAKGHELAEPAGSACRKWGRRGSVWSTVDSLGRVVGKARVAGMERYDVTNCDELVMKTVSGSAGVGVYVSRGYKPLALTAWQMEPSARRGLEEMMKRRDAALPKSSLNERDIPFKKRLLAWKTPGGEEMAVVGGRGLTVLRHDKGAWTVVYRITPGKGEVAHAETFMPLSALDMNGDGTVEIVIHNRDIDNYGDFTLTPKKGSYARVESGIYGAFA